MRRTAHSSASSRPWAPTLCTMPEFSFRPTSSSTSTCFNAKVVKRSCSFVADHEEAYRKLQQHKVQLPSSVQGWHLLRRASLTREQRRMITLKAPSLEKQAVIEAMYLYLILGQDYRGGGWNAQPVVFSFHQSSWRSPCIHGRRL